MSLSITKIALQLNTERDKVELAVKKLQIRAFVSKKGQRRVNERDVPAIRDFINKPE